MNSPAITFRTLDEAPQRLWHEWVRGYFDGGTHQLGGSGVPFPGALMGVDQDQFRDAQGRAQDLLTGVGIRVVCRTEDQARYLSASGRDCEDVVDYVFLIQSSMAGNAANQGNARYQCRQAAQLLHGLFLDDAALLPLARKGIRNISIHSTDVIEGDRFYTRSIRVTAELQYEATPS